ncbi:MAG: tRNA pseudouridine(55) synthase TruB [Tissierella sp.]|uniref:tRNA pseudouridine(55) synthase TruB n=1 Tax=Tissierella sp. TaxID=41274 RepID=UPI003F969C08
MKGIINFYKPKGMTSHDAVNFFRRLLNMKRIGHTGTLDPNAEGVLPICIGKATRVSEYLINVDKEYLGELTLGISTDTQDKDGKTINESHKEVTEEDIKASFKRFKGNISQIPPMFSAIKKSGKKLYELAREGKTIEREPRNITIYKLDIKEIFNNKKIRFLTKCSKGTYIRTLCNDIGEDLGTFGHMSDLIRVNVGPFKVENSYRKEDLESLNSIDIKKLMIPIDFALMKFNEINIPDKFYNKLVNGVKIEINESTHPLGTTLRVYSKYKFIGIGEVIEKNHLKLLKMNKVFV